MRSRSINCLLDINILNSRLVWALDGDVDSPVTHLLLFEDHFDDVCIVWEWSVRVCVEIANCEKFTVTLPA
jgi:hypothetical protein